MKENYNHKEAQYVKETKNGPIRIPYSFPLAGPHETDTENSEEIKQWRSLVEKLN